MFFQDSEYALSWLDNHPACQKEIFINDKGEVFIGDFDWLIGYGLEDAREWDSASVSDLVTTVYDRERC